jgi:V/A-type H+-transporting ATPase subunit I
MILKLPSLTAWADAGWICILWSAFLLAKVLILGNSFPAIGKWLIITGILSVIFFTSPQKNIFKAIGAGLGALALSLMNNFTDVVSYMRLFAVGLAGVAIANTFNSLAAGVGRGNIFAIFLSLIIIIAGHALNLLLGPMSVLVHGIRLNVLEFCGHVDVKWSGFAYKPLKE